MHYILLLIIVWFGALFLGKLCTRIHLPSIIGQLLAGIIVGPTLLNWFQPDKITHLFADLGLIVLMFLAGMTSDWRTLRKYWRASLITALGGMLVPLILLIGWGRWQHLPMNSSVFVGIIFAATSVAVSVAVLQEWGQLKSKAGQIILGAAVIDDLLAILLVSVFNSLQHDGNGTVSLWWAVVYLLFIISAFWFIKKLFRFVQKYLALPQAVLLFSLIWCFGNAYLAELTGLSMVFGAFIAGLIWNELPNNQIINEQWTALSSGFLAPLFFLQVGLQLNLHTLNGNWINLLILLILAVLTKFIGAGLGALVVHLPWKSAGMIGVAMISRGEMALILVQIGLSKQLISGSNYALIVAVIILTTIITPLLLSLFKLKSR
ncbi:cation:proton antiporter [Bombilactobacillus thymidiniphilus]|uniref:Cation:proton antiporter n=1 Tax=Bombilactobacillus thymidiniphilus TaxID=2923363 RepID=A0ABY4PF03_9LACO|nr:cation:proton antiporter [Bombilactobacillus thymidiniphilus]UQS84248.1 cation:proton antiporter [Bombilactobacillus thymidiniphilus]